MKLGTSNYKLWISKDGKVFSNLNTTRSLKEVTDPTLIKEQIKLRDDFSSSSWLTEMEKAKALETYCINHGLDPNPTLRTYNKKDTPFTLNNQTPSENTNTYDPAQVEDAIQTLMNFFSEFDFEPNFRFINTFAYATSKSFQKGQSYIINYFKLIDSPDLNTIIDKMKSDEYTLLSSKFSSLTPNKKINNRFKIYYGAAGTGKTTMAIEEANGNCMVCHSAMLPSDLMEDFKFENGKATFIPSALQNAMENGTPIVLDEINLLPFESLRFLQTILDGKKQFEYKGKTVHINDGFKVIGTMNLKVNGSTFCLPDPLVDRAEELREFKLKAKDLVGAII